MCYTAFLKYIMLMYWSTITIVYCIITICEHSAALLMKRIAIIVAIIVIIVKLLLLVWWKLNADVKLI